MTSYLIQLEKTVEGLSITVADPTQIEKEFCFTVSGKYNGEYATYNSFRNVTILKIPLPAGAEAGKCVTIELKSL